MASEILKSETIEMLGTKRNSIYEEETRKWPTKKNFENKGVPNFLMETILKILPDKNKEKLEATRNSDCKVSFLSCKSPQWPLQTENAHNFKTYARFQGPNVVYQDSDRYRSALHNFTYQLHNWSKYVQLSYRNLSIPPAKFSQNAVYPSPQRPTHGYFLSPNTSPKQAEVWNPSFCEQKRRISDENLPNFRRVPKSEADPLKKLNQLSENLDRQRNDKAEEDIKPRHSFNDSAQSAETRSSSTPSDESRQKDSPPSEENKEKQDGQIWPAWVYCTRYSDRPSAGPRIRRNKRKLNEGKSPEIDGADKRARTAFSEHQLQCLQKEFEQSQYLTEERRIRLAKDLGLKVAQIKVWFQNKRAKVKKMSGVRNGLAMDLIAQGLYNHCTQDSSEEK